MAYEDLPRNSFPIDNWYSELEAKASLLGSTTKNVATLLGRAAARDGTTPMPSAREDVTIALEKLRAVGLIEPIGDECWAPLLQLTFPSKDGGVR